LGDGKGKISWEEQNKWEIGLVFIVFGVICLGLAEHYTMVYPVRGQAPIYFWGYFLIGIGAAILIYRTWEAFKGRTLRNFKILNFAGWLAGGIVLYFIMDMLDFLFREVGFWRLAFWKSYPLPVTVSYFLVLSVFSFYQGTSER